MSRSFAVILINSKVCFPSPFPGNSCHRVRNFSKSFTFITIGGSECKSGNDTSDTNEQMTMKSIVGLFLGITITIIGNTSEDPASGRTSETTQGNGTPVNQVNGSSECL
jgi:hypothetical protein